MIIEYAEFTVWTVKQYLSHKIVSINRPFIVIRFYSYRFKSPFLKRNFWVTK